MKTLLFLITGVIYSLSCMGHKSAPNQAVDGLLGILEFEDKFGTSSTLLDCVILKPLHVFSIN